jgi:hypothetical protein
MNLVATILFFACIKQSLNLNFSDGL